MRISSLPLLTSTFLLLVIAAEHEQPGCDRQACAAHEPDDLALTRNTRHDSVSLLQSRGVIIEYADDAGPDSKSASASGSKTASMSNTGTDAAKAKASPSSKIASTPSSKIVSKSMTHAGRAKAKAPALVTRHTLQQHVGSGWSTVLVLFLIMGACWLTCGVVGYTKMLVKEDQLESRVTSVLQPEALPAGTVLPSHAPVASRFSPLLSPILPNVRQAANDPGAEQEEARLQDMPPPLATSHPLLASEMRLLIAKDSMLAAAKGGEIMLMAPNGAPLMRATVRKVDDDFWLDVSMHAEGNSPSAMIRLTNKDAPTGFSFFGSQAASGPEVYGPEGSYYGNLQMNSSGAQLISSTTGLPVLDIAGDVRRLQPELAVRTNMGLQLASVNCHGAPSGGDKVDICIHRGADLALIISSVLTVFLSSQM